MTASTQSFKYGMYQLGDCMSGLVYVKNKVNSVDPSHYAYAAQCLFYLSGEVNFLPIPFTVYSEAVLTPGAYAVDLTFNSPYVATITQMRNINEFDLKLKIKEILTKSDLSKDDINKLNKAYSVENIILYALKKPTVFKELSENSQKELHKVISMYYIATQLCLYGYDFKLFNYVPDIVKDMNRNCFTINNIFADSYLLLKYQVPFKKVDYIASVSKIRADSYLRYGHIINQEFLTAFDQDKLLSIKGSELKDYIFNPEWLKHNSGFHKQSAAVFNQEVATKVFSNLIRKGIIHMYSTADKSELHCTYEQYLTAIETGRLKATEVYFSTHELYLEQQRLIDTVAARANKDNFHFLPKEEVLLGIADYEKEKHIILNESQKSALINMFSKQKITLLVGAAGTGKTTTIKAFLYIYRHKIGRWNNDYIEDRISEVKDKLSKSTPEVIQVPIMAYTGRAASSYTNLTQYDASDDPKNYQYLHAGTIHSSMRFSTKENQKRPAFMISDFAIIDEASMLDFTLMHRFFNHLSYRTKIVLTGDPNQIAPIHGGQFFYDLLNCINLHNSVVKLSHVYRQANQSQVTALTKQVLKGEKYDPSKMIGTGSVEFQKSTDTKEVLSIAQDYVLNKDNIQDTIILTAQKYTPLGTIALNQAIQKNLFPSESDYIVNENLLTFHNGERVIQTANDYEMRNGNVPVMNGEVGTLFFKQTNSDKNSFTTKQGNQVKVFVLFDTGTKKPILSMKQLNSLDQGYAITVHKAQGLEKKSVMLVLDPAQYRMWNRNILYTGVTRAKENLLLIGSDAVYNKALHTIDNHIDKEFVQKLNDKILELNPLHVTQAEVDALPF